MHPFARITLSLIFTIALPAWAQKAAPTSRPAPASTQPSAGDDDVAMPIPPGMEALLQSASGGAPAGESAIPESLKRTVKDFKDNLIDSSGKQGLLVTVGKAMSEAQSRSQKQLVWSVNIRPEIKRARLIKASVQRMLFDSSISPTERFAIYSAYINDVLLPLRELVVLGWDDDFRPEKTDPLENMLPNLPEEVVATPQLKTVAGRGLDPSNPWGLLIEEFPKEIQACKGQVRAVFDTDPLASVVRDIKAFSHAVNADTYVRAIKQLAAHMMISQLRQFDTFINSEEPAVDEHGNYLPDRVKTSSIDLNGCQTSLGGGLPAHLELPLPPYAAPGGRLDQMDMILVHNGLLLGKGEERPFYNELVSDTQASPEKGDFAGYLPFERLRAAERGLNPAKRHPNPYKRKRMEPAFDDQADFTTTFEQILPEIAGAYSSNSTLWPTVQRITQIEQDKIPMGDPKMQYMADTKGLSKELVHAMQVKGVSDWEEAVPANVKGALIRHTLIHAMPPLDSPDTNRRWAMSELSSFAEKWKDNDAVMNTVENGFEGKDRQKVLNDFLGKACAKNPKASYCSTDKRLGKRWLDFLSQKLAQFRDPSRYVPKVAFEDKELREIYPYLMEMWDTLAPADNMYIHAKQSEWDYIKATIHTNPWASMRVAYEMAKRSVDPPGYKNPYRQLGKALGFEIEPRDGVKLDKFGINCVVNGKITNCPATLHMFHANRVLSDAQKKKIWQDTLRQGDDLNGHIFSVKLPSTGEPLYEKLSDIHSLPPLLSEKDAVEAINKYMPEQERAAALRRIHEYWAGNSPKKKPTTAPSTRPTTGPTTGPAPASQQDEEVDPFFMAENLRKIYEAKPNSDEQAELVAKQLKEGGMRSLNEVRGQFLAVDGEQKRLMYHAYIREAAKERRAKVQKLLSELCKLKPGDNQQFKDIIRRTMEVQDELNKYLGVPGLPPEVQAQLDKWLPRDKENIKLAGLQFVTFALASTMAATCIAGTAGACSPLAVTLLYTASTATGLKMAHNTYLSRGEAQARMAKTQEYADIGLSNEQGVEDSAEGYGGIQGYANIVLDALGSVTPMKGTFLSYELSYRASKAAFVEGVHAVEESKGMRSLLYKGFAGTKNVAVHSAEDLGALIGRMPSSEYSELMANVVHEHELARGARILEMATRGAEVLKAPREALLKDATASYGKTISKEFGNDPRLFRQYLEGRVGSRLEDLEREIKLTKDLYSNPEKLSYFKLKLKKLGVPERKIDKLTRRLYYGKKISTISAELRAIEASGGNLAKYVEDNALELSEIMNNVPGTWLDVPYNFVMEGSPYLGRNIPGTAIRTPLASVSDGYITRRASLAYENMVYHAYRDEALKVLNKGAEFKPLQDTYDAVQQFMNLAATVPNSQKAELATMRSEMGKKVYDYQRLMHGRGVPSAEKFMQVLWEPKNPYEEMIAAGWWNSTPPEQLFKDFKTYKSPARTVQYLASTYSDTKDMKDLEDYLTAFKLLVYSKHPQQIPH